MKYGSKAPKKKKKGRVQATFTIGHIFHLPLHALQFDDVEI